MAKAKKKVAKKATKKKVAKKKTTKAVAKKGSTAKKSAAKKAAGKKTTKAAAKKKTATKKPAAKKVAAKKKTAAKKPTAKKPTAKKVKTSLVSSKPKKSVSTEAPAPEKELVTEELEAQPVTEKTNPTKNPSKAKAKKPAVDDDDIDNSVDGDDHLDEDFEGSDEEVDLDLVDEAEDVDEDWADDSDEVILTDAEGRRYCKVRDCDQISVVEGYCRYHYLLFWKRIQTRKKILKDGKLRHYIEELTSRYPDKHLETLRKDLKTEKDFLAAIRELEIDESSSSDSEYEDEAQSYIAEVRGLQGGDDAGGDDDY